MLCPSLRSTPMAARACSSPAEISLGNITTCSLTRTHALPSYAVYANVHVIGASLPKQLSGLSSKGFTGMAKRQGKTRDTL